MYIKRQQVSANVKNVTEGGELGNATTINTDS